MTPEEYEKELTELENKFDSEKTALDEKYAAVNNTVKIGDLVTDHIGTIKVEKIKTAIINSVVPHCAYWGTRITKDSGKPYKRGGKRWVAQYNIKKGDE